MKIPAGWVLTNDEVVALLTKGEQGKREGIAPEFVPETPELYAVKMPVGTAITHEDLRIAITRLNDAAEYGNSDVLFSFQDGRMVKRGWITMKDPRRENRPPALTIGGQKPRMEF